MQANSYYIQESSILDYLRQPLVELYANENKQELFEMVLDDIYNLDDSFSYESDDATSPLQRSREPATPENYSPSDLSSSSFDSLGEPSLAQDTPFPEYSQNFNNCDDFHYFQFDVPDSELPSVANIPPLSTEPKRQVQQPTADVTPNKKKSVQKKKKSDTKYTFVEGRESIKKSKSAPGATQRKFKKTPNKPQHLKEDIEIVFNEDLIGICQNWLTEEEYRTQLLFAVMNRSMIREDFGNDISQEGSFYFTRQETAEDRKKGQNYWLNCGRRKEDAPTGVGMRVFYRKSRTDANLRKRMFVLKDYPTIVLHHIVKAKRGRISKD